jgi:hypothetical protein
MFLNPCGLLEVDVVAEVYVVWSHLGSFGSVQFLDLRVESVEIRTGESCISGDTLLC